MRSAVEAILKWHRGMHSPDLRVKLGKMSESPFRFFRGTYFLYTADIRTGAFRRPAPLAARGPVVGDVHTENYGCFRSISGDIVYDINDFDETTKGYYEWDVRRLAVSLVLAALENGHRLGDGVNAAEAAIRAWLDGLQRWAGLGRKEFAGLPERRQVRELLLTTQEKSRVKFLEGLTEESSPGRFTLRLEGGLHGVSSRERKAAMDALEFFLGHCLTSAGAHPERYRLCDIAARTAGNGSLGRLRYALLLDKGKTKTASLSTLRLIEWKQALDSALDSPFPHAGKGRAKAVYTATKAFQLFPKRYLGYTSMDGVPMQGRELGANDARFSHREFVETARFGKAAGMFGGLLARCHLLGAEAGGGPRGIPRSVAGFRDRFVNGILQFAVSYAEQAHADFEELGRRREEVHRAWTK
ncbi:MAG: DUF2252 family protein [Bryobacterales bacterium]|nr:DUF2252 family protein [Bryobacterales bacterium]